MNIYLPTELNHTSLKLIIGKAYLKSTLSNDDTCIFDWTKTRWAELPEIVSLLSWSASLAQQLKKQVVWKFYDTKILEEDQNTYAIVSHILDNSTYNFLKLKIKKLKDQAKMFDLQPKNVEHTFSEIRKIASFGQDSVGVKKIEEWIDLEREPFKYMSLLTYLDRYQVFHRAYDVGIKLDPTPKEIPRFVKILSEETGCLELKSIQSKVEVGVILDELSNPQELARVFDKYSGLDVVQGGTLAHILITELGMNVDEHSEATAAWLCSRIISEQRLIGQTRDPALKSFFSEGEGFLEVIVCDNGIGLTSKLYNVLINDSRESVKNKYAQNTSEINALYIILPEIWTRA